MNKLTHVAELAFIRSIFDLLKDDMKPGRLKGKYEALQKEVDKVLSNMKIDEKEELPIIGKALELFASKTGWNEKERSIGTILSFTLSLIEESENTFSDKIMQILNEIFEYYERFRPFSALCYSAGAVATEKWNMTKKEVLWEI